jgi:hypothetical protein
LDNLKKRGRPTKPKVAEADNIEQVGEQIAQSKRGSKSASIEKTTTASKDEIKDILKNSLYWYNREIVKTDDECAERLNEFFTRLAETGEIPTVEKMCLALGTVRQTVYDWEQGTQGNVRSVMIKKAKEILASLDAELVSRGKIPQITYIFRAKNFFGMQDKQEYVLTPNSPLGSDGDPATMARKYQSALPETTIDCGKEDV